MKKYLGQIAAIALIPAAFLFTDVLHPSAQKMPVSSAGTKKIMPEVVILADKAEQGTVTFNHVRHNGGEYRSGGPIICIECHHTAQPASELLKSPPLKTAWPAGRTTTLTAELFAADPNGAGVAACRDCHARKGTKPKLLDKIPVLKDQMTGEATELTSQVIFHQACDTCHFEIEFRTTGSKVPNTGSCSTCHKSTKKPR